MTHSETAAGVHHIWLYERAIFKCRQNCNKVVTLATLAARTESETMMASMVGSGGVSVRRSLKLGCPLNRIFSQNNPRCILYPVSLTHIFKLFSRMRRFSKLFFHSSILAKIFVHFFSLCMSRQVLNFTQNLRATVLFQ